MQPPYLPRFSSSFVGRSDEIASTAAALCPGRMLTLVGPGGSGKTRLAARVATDISAHWPDGVGWIGLDAALDDSSVAATVARALSITARTGAEQAAVLGTLAGAHRLLVLDNCEHVRAGVRAFVDDLLHAAPGVAVMSTSRMPVGAGWERVHRIGPLNLEDAHTLLLSRAEAAGVPRPGSAGARSICDRLDRLPLAIELAAGWMTTLSVDEIAARLAQPLDLLESSADRAPLRLRSVAASVQWSHDLLEDGQRTVFRRLAGFQRGFTAEQAQAVCGDADLDAMQVLRHLRALVDASLLIADTESAPARYGMLDVIAAYARARLTESGEEPMIRDRHLRTYHRLAERLLPTCESDKDAWRASLASEYGNLIAAMQWGLSGPAVSTAIGLATDLAWLWHLESRRPEGIPLLTAAVRAAVGQPPAVRARAEVALALVADTAAPDTLRSSTAALKLATEAGDQPTARLARLLLALGLIADDPAEARRLAHENRTEAMAAGDVFNEHASSVLLGILHSIDDEHSEALTLLGPATETLRARGNRGVASTGLAYMAMSTARTGDLERSIEIARQAVECADPLHDLHRIGHASVTLAELLAMQGAANEALSVVEPIALLIESDDQPAPVPGWELVRARMAAWTGQYTEAVEWCLRGIRLAEQGTIDAKVDLAETQLELASALRLIGDTDRATTILAEATGNVERIGRPRLRANSLEQAALLARDPEAAYAGHQEALRIRVDIGLSLDLIDSLEQIAGVAASYRSPALAVVLAAAAQAAQDAGGYAARTSPLDASLAGLVADPANADAARRGRDLGLNAVELARRMRGPRDRPGTGWGSLTPTERAVVDLAAHGLSNPQIAERLFVSGGTVKTHLAHVYEKLGIANRTELAAAHRAAGARFATSPPARARLVTSSTRC